MHVMWQTHTYVCACVCVVHACVLCVVCAVNACVRVQMCVGAYVSLSIQYKHSHLEVAQLQ